MSIEGFSLQAGEVPAELDRRARYALLQRGASVGSIAGGIVGATDLEITIGTGLHIKIAAGECFVPGSSSATQSGYYILNSSSLEKSIAAANETNPRIDRVIVRVYDAAYTGSENKYEIEVLTGTPTSGANLTNLSGAPAQPVSSLTIGYVEVKAKATTPSGVSFVATRVLSGLPWLITKITNASVTASAGEFVEETKSGTTITLPTPTAGGLLAVFYAETTGQVTVKASSGAIVGDFISSTECKLAANQHLLLYADGTNWRIIGGEPKREQVYSARAKGTSGKEEEPSATRPTQVILEGFNKGAFAMTVEVGGVPISQATTPAEASGGNSGQTVSFICPAGIKWKATLSGGTVEYSYLML